MNTGKTDEGSVAARSFDDTEACFPLVGSGDKVWNSPAGSRQANLLRAWLKLLCQQRHIEDEERMLRPPKESHRKWSWPHAVAEDNRRATK